MPLLDVFWSMLWFFLWIAWFWTLVMVISDIFRSHDLGGWGKALWSLFVVFLPFLGVFVYLIARGGSMHERAVARAQYQEQATQDYIKSVAAPSPADEIAKLQQLHDAGTIDDAEFTQLKAKALQA